MNSSESDDLLDELAINGQQYVDTHLLQDTLNSTKELKVRTTNKKLFEKV